MYALLRRLWLTLLLVLLESDANHSDAEAIARFGIKDMSQVYHVFVSLFKTTSPMRMGECASVPTDPKCQLNEKNFPPNTVVIGRPQLHTMFSPSVLQLVAALVQSVPPAAEE